MLSHSELKNYLINAENGDSCAVKDLMKYFTEMAECESPIDAGVLRFFAGCFNAIVEKDVSADKAFGFKKRVGRPSGKDDMRDWLLALLFEKYKTDGRTNEYAIEEIGKMYAYTDKAIYSAWKENHEKIMPTSFDMLVYADKFLVKRKP